MHLPAARHLVPLLALLLVAGVLAPPGGPSPAAAAACTTAQLVPALREVVFDQGVGSYGKLIRGKQAIVRLHLSLPTGCTAASGQSIVPTNARIRLEVPVGSGQVVAFTKPYLPLSGKLGARVLVDSPADPLFQVPGSTLQPSVTRGEFRVRLTATVTYTRVAGGTSTPGLTRTFNAIRGSQITRTVEARTNALRILVVPAGDAAKPFSTQFSSEAQASVVRGMSTVARVLPVPDGTGDLQGDRGGIRYTINAGMLDIGSRGLDLLDGAGFFCGTDSTFAAVKGPLGAILQDWNQANPDATADRVLMVVDAAISRSGGNRACDEGRAAVPAPNRPAVAAWVRAIPDTASTPSRTGALMVMELAHTFGLVVYRAAETPQRTLPGTYHSLNTAADVTDPDTAYNLITRRFIPDDRSAMKLSGAGWHDGTVVLEKNDWEHLACALGGQTTPTCTIPDQAGTTDGIAAGPVFVLSGTTDGRGGGCPNGPTGRGTCVVESYYNGVEAGDDGAAPTAQDPDSRYRLLYLDADGAVLNSDGRAPAGDGFGVPVSRRETEHGSGGGGSDGGAGDPDQLLFSIAFPFTNPGRTERIRLVRLRDDGSPLTLYERRRSAPPIITRLATPRSASQVIFAWDDPDTDTGFDLYRMEPDGSGLAQLTDTPADDRDPKVSPDGRLIVFARRPAGGGDSELFLINADGNPNPTNLTQAPDWDDTDPDWSPDGERIVFAREIDPQLGVRNLHWLTYAGFYASGSQRWRDGTVVRLIDEGSTELDAPMDGSQTTMELYSDMGPGACTIVDVPQVAWLARIEDELLRVTGGFGSCTVTVERGVLGTTAVAHDQGRRVRVVGQLARDERQPVFSPTGQRLAFVRTPVGGDPDIWRMNVSTDLTYDDSPRGREDEFGPDFLNLGRSSVTDTSLNPPGRRLVRDPSWSPDGTRIAFTNDWGGDLDVSVVRVGNGEITPVTTGGAADQDPWFDPRSGRLLFISDRDGGVNRVFAASPDLDTITALPQGAGRRGTDPAWYPREQQSLLLVYRSVEDGPPGSFDIFTMTPEGGDVQRLTINGTANQDARWSPDGRRIAYSGYFDTYARSDIYVMGRNGLESRNLTDDQPGNKRQPTWSPDGSRIAYIRGGELWTMRSGNGGAREILFDGPGTASTPAWSPDGDRIAFVVTDGDRSHIWLIDPDGSGLTQLTSGNRRDLDPAWSPDGTTLAIARGPSPAPSQQFVSTDIVTIDPANGDVVRTYTNAPHEDPPRDDVGPSYDRPTWSPDGLSLAWRKAFPCPVCLDDVSFDPDLAELSIETARVNGSDIVERTADGKAFGADWSPGEDTVLLAARLDDPEDARADILFECSDGGTTHIVAAGVEPDDVEGRIASFRVNFDAGRACGNGQPRIIARVNDGYSISRPSAPEPFLSDPKPPTAGIASPRGGARVALDEPIALGADAEDPEQGNLGTTAFGWRIDGRSVGVGRTLDVAPPNGGWEPGQRQVTLIVTDGSGRRTRVRSSFAAVLPFAWVDPTSGSPALNRAVAGEIVELSFTIRGEDGLDILAGGGWPRSSRERCGTGSIIPGTQYRTRPFGREGLSFDAATGVYTYAWRTRAEWGRGALACRVFELRLTDGTTRRARVRFSAP